MNTIKKFFENNPNRLIPPIILSSRGKWIFNGTEEIGELEIESEAAIIDGQHRAGVWWLYMNRMKKFDNWISCVLKIEYSRRDR